MAPGHKPCQPRIHWTRARARAMNASDSETQEQSNAPSPSKRAKSPQRPDATKSQPPTYRPKPIPKDAISAEFKKMKAALMQELGEEVYIVSEEWTKSLYRDLADQASLDQYLASENSGYTLEESGKGRWKEMPRLPKDESELYQPVAAILSRLVKDLEGPSCREGVTRKVVNSHASDSTFRYKDLKDLCPDISIVATGPSFERDDKDDEYVVGIGYSNVASVVEVKLDRALGGPAFNEIEQASQMAFYCRTMFTKQPNRHFVRSMVITEDHVRIVHYDRGGFYFSPLLNIHQDPTHSFDLSSGLAWSVDPKTGKKASGTIEGLDAEGLATVYRINMDHSPFVRTQIKGRGTTCWHATDPKSGRDVFIKDAWRAISKISEYSYLQAAQGVEGVAQMVSFQDDCATTKDYRPGAMDSVSFEHKTKSRLVVVRYGKSIEHFTSRYQAIAALRDAIVAHRILLSKSILHRDIAMQNILLGAENASPGSRGILIDLDMATWTFKDVTEQRAEAGVGVRRFQSASVLWSLIAELPPIQDYLDDLESFFYVLCHLVVLFDRPGKRNMAMDDTLARWETEGDLQTVMNGKAAICCGNCPQASLWWGDSSDALVKGFRKLIWEAMADKIAIRRNHWISHEEQRQRLEAVAKDYGDIHDKVIKLFDDALASFEQEDLASSGLPVSPIEAEAVTPAIDPAFASTISASPIVPSDEVKVGTSVKRRLDDDTLDNVPPPKRSRPSKPAAPPKPRKRVPKVCAELPPLPQGVRRSARLNRS
ncbi:hypothetical protein DFP72DRAFT_881339 [Ephemerocybe angulata]|uniref:Fungal-type protein kinase domain-containing protein n=1 Tax=Ephemerocybe angulata TaxID=980116 RepID=A0A8H6IAF2_9AGAR|nr:hypothetical protein DFP72DRAFT_881339 [Tulosesus angulatus]